MAEDSIEPLITECPGCHTRFRVTEAQLGMASGRVRCGACLAVFRGADHLVIGLDGTESTGQDADAALDALLNELSEESLAREAVHKEPPPVPRVVRELAKPLRLERPGREPMRPAPVEPKPPPLPAVVDKHPANEHPPVDVVETLHRAPPIESPNEPTESQRSTTHVEEIELAAVGEIGRETPVPAAAESSEVTKQPAARVPAHLARDPLFFDLEEAPPPRRRRWWLVPAVLAAAVALAGQVLWFQFDEWSKDPQLRGLYEGLCAGFGCELPRLRAVERFYTKNLVVRSHPEMPGALVVDALIVNGATFAQPFPVLELRFSAIGGNLVAARRFDPGEYLAGELAGAEDIAPDTPVHVSIEIDDPGPDAVNYILAFR